MKQGRPFAEVLTDVKRIHASKRDYVADTRAMQFSTDAGGSLLSLAGLPESEPISTFTVDENTHGQIRERLAIPADYYKRLRNTKDLHDLLDFNVNRLLNHEPQRRMVRTLEGKARAFLSDRYQVIDNWDILATCLPEIQELSERHGAVVESCELTDSRLYLKVRIPGIQYNLGKITEGEYRGMDDVLNPMLIISNSEVGKGSSNVHPGIFRDVCSNGMVWEEAAFTQYHVTRGTTTIRKGAGEGAYVAELFSDETKAADDRAYLLKMRDVMRTALTSISFESLVQRFGETKGLAIKKPVAAIEVIKDRYGLTDGYGEKMIEALIAGGDMSMYGLINAVTRVAQDIENYEYASDLEEVGGKMLNAAQKLHSEILVRSR